MKPETVKLIKRLVSTIIKEEKLPVSLICLSCLATQPTARVISNDNACVICDSSIDPYNLSDIEV